MNRSLKKIPLAALGAARAGAGAGGATDATITVDASKVEGSVTPWLYGACIEDVNHEIYGGLYDHYHSCTASSYCIVRLEMGI